MGAIGLDSSRHSGWKRCLVAFAMALAVVAVAAAHVTVNPTEVRPNSFESFTVRVPTEKDEPTVKVRIEFPAALTVSRFQPKPGWKRDIEKDNTGRIAAATWSGGQVGPDEYEEFVFLARTPKEPGKLVFKAFQTYQSGETVAWIGAEGAEEPAPVVEVKPGPEGSATGVENATVTSGAAASVAPVMSTTVSVDATPVTATASAGGPVVDTPVMATPSVAPEETSAGAAMATMEPAALPASGGGAAVTTAGGSDLPLFASLGALTVAGLALALAGISLARRRTA
jgi:uncharacterized protein YcnI